MSQLVGELRTVLEPFIDPESDHLGHAFRIDGPSGGAVHRNRRDGLSEFEFKSKVQDFANSLVQAAAIIGVERTMQLLANWQAGEPIRFRTSTFVNGLIPELCTAGCTGGGLSRQGPFGGPPKTWGNKVGWQRFQLRQSTPRRSPKWLPSENSIAPEGPFCQGRWKIRPLGRSKTRPFVG